MVIFSNTVIDPLAMMVKLVHTSIAYVAVSGITCENGFACRTEAVSVVFFNKLIEA